MSGGQGFGSDHAPSMPGELRQDPEDWNRFCDEVAAEVWGIKPHPVAARRLRREGTIRGHKAA